MTHRASSNSWGDNAGARLCELIVASNTGAAQNISEGRTEMLDLMSLEQLNEPDDIGLSLPFLCVYYDRPELLIYLKKRGVDINAKCDPMKFGTPLFYAIQYRRYRLIETFDRLGVNLGAGCDDIDQTPLTHAKRMDDPRIAELVTYFMTRTANSAILIQRNFLRKMGQREAMQRKKAVQLINRIFRGAVGRRRMRQKRREEMEGYD